LRHAFTELIKFSQSVLRGRLVLIGRFTDKINALIRTVLFKIRQAKLELRDRVACGGSGG